VSKTPYFDKVQERYAIPEPPTLRDQFAMAALTGFVASGKLGEAYTQEVLAGASYQIADAMMEAREAK